MEPFTNLEDSEKEFGLITAIIKENDVIIFQLKIFDEITFDSHYHDYVIKATTRQKIFKFKDLLKIDPCFSLKKIVYILLLYGMAYEMKSIKVCCILGKRRNKVYIIYRRLSGTRCYLSGGSQNVLSRLRLTEDTMSAEAHKRCYLGRGSENVLSWPSNIAFSSQF